MMKTERQSDRILSGTNNKDDGRPLQPCPGAGGPTYFISEPRFGPDPVGNLAKDQRLADRFTIISCLGQGSIGAVYRAFDDLRSAEVALKVVAVTSEESADLLRHEIQQSAKVTDYSHVIHIHDIHTERCGGFDLLLISMEYAEGGCFREWLVQNRDDVVRRRTEGIAYILQACKGLQALHQAGIIHMDLKPENLLSKRGVLKIADLGLSQCVKAIGSRRDASIDRETQSWVGTPAYMSPQQFIAACTGHIDERSDIYSVGAILFETCSEQCNPPFIGSYEQIREAHFHMSVPPIRGVEVNIARAISRCLQKDPANRYADVGELIDELEGRKVVQGEGSPDSQQAQETERLWRHACDLVESGDLNSAGRVCTEILSRFPEYSDAKDLLQGIQERFEQARQFYVTIRKGIGCQPFARLVALLVAAVEIYPDHPEGLLVQTELASVIQENNLVIRDAVSALRQGHWQAALTCFERAALLNPGQPAVAQAIEFLKQVPHQIETTRANIGAAIQRGNGERALLLARQLDSYIKQARESADYPQSPEPNHDTER
jgi:serine/threonine protein kinase